MTLSETILGRVAEWRPSGTERETLSVLDKDSGWTVAVVSERCDELGCLVWELGMRHAPTPGVPGSEALRTWANRTASRVTGLLDPLKVLEVDVQRNEALLRSNAPVRRGADSFYFEVHLKGTTEANLRRYRVKDETGHTREQVAFPLTHEMLARIVVDLAAQQ